MKSVNTKTLLSGSKDDHKKKDSKEGETRGKRASRKTLHTVGPPERRGRSKRRKQLESDDIYVG